MVDSPHHGAEFVQSSNFTPRVKKSASPWLQIHLLWDRRKKNGVPRIPVGFFFVRVSFSLGTGVNFGV